MVRVEHKSCNKERNKGSANDAGDDVGLSASAETWATVSQNGGEAVKTCSSLNHPRTQVSGTRKQFVWIRARSAKKPITNVTYKKIPLEL